MSEPATILIYDFNHCKHCPCSWWDHRGPYSPDGPGCNGHDGTPAIESGNRPATGLCDCPGYAVLTERRKA